MSDEFYKLCINQYYRELEDSDNIYQKASVILIVIPILIAAMIALGRIDVLRMILIRIDVFLYYLFSLVAIVAFAISIVFLFIQIRTRKYHTLASMDAWNKWKDEYQAHLNNQENQEGDIEQELFGSITIKLVEAQPVNADINEKRRKAFGISVFMIGIATAAIAAQAVFYLIIKLQEVYK